MIDQCVAAVHDLLLQNLPLKSKKTPSGWTSFNCPMCSDRRMRGGVNSTGPKIVYRCFNCPFRASWGATPFISKRYRQLCERLGTPEEQIQAAQLLLIQHRDELTEISELDSYVHVPDDFKTIDLPSDAIEIINLPEDNPLRQYAAERDILGRYTLYHFPTDPSSDEENRKADPQVRKRVFIPFLYDGQLIGWNGRHINPPTKRARYKIHLPKGGKYVFNLDNFVDSEREIGVVLEGTIDAIRLDCMSIQSNELSEGQIDMLRRTRKRIIIVPDIDDAGTALMKQALREDFEVSIPPWHRSCKDADDACSRYGRLATVASIIKYATKNDVRAEVQMNVALQDRIDHN